MDGIVIFSRIVGGVAIDIVAVWMIFRSMSCDDGRDTDALCIVALLLGLVSLFVHPAFVSMMFLLFGGAMVSMISANVVWPPHPTRWDREHRQYHIITLLIGLGMIATGFAILCYLAYTEPLKVIPPCLC